MFLVWGLAVFLIAPSLQLSVPKMQVIVIELSSQCVCPTECNNWGCERMLKLAFSSEQSLPTLPSFPVECSDVYIVERLFSSSLVVVVSLSMPRRMNVYHFKKGTEICNYSYSNNILSVRLNRQVRTGRGSSSPRLIISLWFAHLVMVISLSIAGSAPGGVPGGVHLHPQYQRHETTQDPAQHTHQPLRCSQTVMHSLHKRKECDHC